MSCNIKPFSYHTFLFPFLWNDGGKRITRVKFTRCLSKNWLPDTNSTDALSAEEFDIQYNKFHYFNAAARNAIYSDLDKQSVVWNYRYDLSLISPEAAQSNWLKNAKNQDNPAKYIIEKGDIKFVLNVNGIGLKLFNTGIGVLVFELENYTYTSPEEIRMINDFGRRIYMPFCENGECSGCADKISLVYGNTTVADDELIGKPASFKSTRLAGPIMHLFNNGEYSVTADAEMKNKNTFLIEPIIDDRMFVACYYYNKEFINDITKWENGEYKYLSDALNNETMDPNNCARRLYEMVFIDNGFLTCRNRTLLRQTLEDHIHSRWIENGSVTGITEFSAICITANEAEFLARNFLTEYIEMMILTLAQRASLLSFEHMISESALNKQDIKKIQKSYILFQSQLQLEEVTPQKQGIELYNKLLNTMFIPEQTQEIESHIEALFAEKNYQNEARENFILFILAIMGIFEAMSCALTWADNDMSDYIKLAVSLGLVLASIIWYILTKRK